VRRSLFSILCFVFVCAIAVSFSALASDSSSVKAVDTVDKSVPRAAGAAAPSIVPKSESVPFKKEGVITAGLLVKLMFGLFFSVLLGAAAVYFLKKYYFGLGQAGTADGKNIRLVEVKRITPKSTLIHIEFKGKQFLLAQTGEQLTVVDRESGGESSEL